MKETLLIDGGGLLKQSKTSVFKSYETYNYKDAILRFLDVLRKILIDNPHINKCVVFWDGENNGKLRHDFYPQYKANRKSKSWFDASFLTELEVSQIERDKKDLLFLKIKVQNYLEEFFVRQCEAKHIEADDCVAYYCNISHKTENITILTNDRDYCQFLNISPNIKISFFNLKGVLVCRDNFHEYFDYHYTNCVLYKTLMGDNGDNIFGIKDFGEKSLYSLIPEIKDRPITLGEVLERAKKTGLKHKKMRNLYRGLDKLFYETISKIYIQENGSDITIYDGFKNKIKVLAITDYPEDVFEKHETPQMSLLDYFEKINGDIENEFFLDVLDGFGVIYSDAFFDRNKRLVDLSKPFVNEDAINEIESAANDILSPINENNEITRGSKKLVKMFYEDKLLLNNQFYQKTYSENFMDYLKPFYNVSGTEFRAFMDYAKENNINIIK